ncbi:hypothetical protein F5X68DRAFT_4136 [Plectosphaerella plurivora]|uniref:Chromo domain-containing protein n=1 Tax=Plectosphaerella plurivora TaxID=936078 RepID=A0A9P8VM16_9PEZI|nr:hypothetical protein F5X68DRAFT_4136 [Plectosphaerella plurivora]
MIIVPPPTGLLAPPMGHFARLIASAADEIKYLQDWRSGIPNYHAPTLDPECSYWEVAHAKKKSPCSISGVPRFFPLKLHGPSNGPVAAVHTRLLSAANSTGIQLNRLHSFMQYLPVKYAIQTFMIQLETPHSPQSPQEKQSNHDWICSDLSTRLGQQALGEITIDGPRYLDRCFVNCLQKLLDLHDEAGHFWDFGTGKPLVDLFGAIIDMFHEAWDAFKPWAPPGSTVEDWFLWTRLTDPWVAFPQEFSLESRPLHEYWATEPEVHTKRGKAPPPWGVWKPTSAELAALQAEASGQKFALSPFITEDMWEFEKILDCKWQGKGRQRKVWFLVQWKGFEATWQPEDDFRGCSEHSLLNFYEKPQAAGPPKWLYA